MSIKPTILLIPGAWHEAGIFDTVAAILRAQGYPVESMTLPSAGGPVSTTVADDAEYIRGRYLKELVAQGKEVVMVMHSYSGIPGTESIQGLARKDLEAQGKQGGVVAIVYISAFLMPAGQSLEFASPHKGLDPAVTIEGDVVYPVNPRAVFYNDLDDENAAKHVAKLVYQAKPSFCTPLMYEAYRDVPAHYLLCKQDASIPLSAQRMMAAMPGRGVVQTYESDAGHCAMLSAPQDVADVIQNASTEHEVRIDVVGNSWKRPHNTWNFGETDLLRFHNKCFDWVSNNLDGVTSEKGNVEYAKS
ncbi:uncharacterized protein N7477_006667 [Penicillium maclennaniae]|uniref:uncharacterized protein n=1 Tax=Penicillium maclennaniae TaxID=1343394 RepID=UPI0025403BAC|nr:uncharacterized protein N7477_006667 [Penicillium maclennaniae]KAJ5668097.1 hypothetical protein N7477_006667 [Penicillium maclennaniae]